MHILEPSTTNIDCQQGERYMIDFNTYKELHSNSPKFVTTHSRATDPGRKEIDASAMLCDTPPSGPEIFAFPNTLIGYNLRQKKWRKWKFSGCLRINGP